MSTVLLSLTGENPWPGLAVAALNLAIGVVLVGVSLLLGITISLLASVHALANRGSLALPKVKRRVLA